MTRIARLRILAGMAWRNLFSHKGKNALVGLLLAFGSFLVVLGGSLLSTIERTMARSITASVAGHLQVYDENARDSLALFGTGFMESPDVGVIPDFKKVKDALLGMDNVKAVVPMGIDAAEFYTDTLLEENIERLRQAHAAADTAGMEAVIGQLRGMAALMQEEFENRRSISSNLAEIEQHLADIRRALTDEFWAGFPTHPDEVIEFLDTRLAPLVEENEGYFLQYLGTDLEQFQRHFDQFELVSGQNVPPGERGLLLNQKFYDDYLRNPIARELDQLQRQIVERRKSIAGDPLLRARVQRMANQYRRITFQLDPAEADLLRDKLSVLLKAEGSLDELVQKFLQVDDKNFQERYRFFFSDVAPLIELYLFNIGDVITIRTYTRSGYVKSANLKVWGTFHFKGLEKSDLAGAYSLMDMRSFRDLYGYMSEEKRRELKDIQAAAGLKDVGRDEAEAALFSDQAQLERVGKGAGGFDETKLADLKAPAPVEQKASDDIDDGLAVNAAVVLRDPSLLQQTRAEIAEANARQSLGIQVVDWQQASGMVGQVVVLVRLVLVVALIIIFLVALIIINNTMVMATMERVVEIGTMRAIGAQSRFVLGLFMLETVLLGLVAATAGAAAGAGVIKLLGKSGIPAVENILIFLFSGPRLYPSVETGHLVQGVLAILVVSLVATFYPAMLAARIRPAVAMQARE